MTTHAVEYDRDHPLRTTLRLLKPYRGKATLALATFAVKDSPLRLLPILTANIIDVIVQRQPLSRLWLNTAILAVVLLQNIPTHTLWVRLSSNVIRSLGADLRSRLAQHVQQLSIGYHSRAGASLLQSKVVRDVENVEAMLQRVRTGRPGALMVRNTLTCSTGTGV